MAGHVGRRQRPSRGYAVFKFSGNDGHVLPEQDLDNASHNWAVDLALDAVLLKYKP